MLKGGGLTPTPPRLRTTLYTSEYNCVTDVLIGMHGLC